MEDLWTTNAGNNTIDISTDQDNRSGSNTEISTTTNATTAAKLLNTFDYQGKHILLSVLCLISKNYLKF